MAATKRLRKIDATSGLRDRSHEAAWKRRTTVSQLAYDGLARYAKHGAAGARLSRVDPGSGKEKIRVYVDDDLWNAAIEKAQEEGLPIAQIVRRVLARINELEKV